MPDFDLIDAALREDIGSGDLTTEYFTDHTRVATARIVAREECVLAGGAVAREVFRRVDPALELIHLLPDGIVLEKGAVALEVRGRAASLLTAERTVLNFLQRLSGVATITYRYVQAVQGTETRILDTRKTTPGWRLLEKAAVAAGGGTNHRIGLYDMVMVKDNHLAACASLDDLAISIRRFKEAHPDIRVELEADTLDQVRAFVAMEGVDVILLDNMTTAQMREAVAMRRDGIEFEASGGITIERLPEIARTGVDYISVGALTHSARAVDLSMEIIDDPA